VVVENVIAGVKRCRIVKDVLPLTTDGISDLVMEIACGLHNLHVRCRHPLPSFDILSLLSSGYSRFALIFARKQALSYARGMSQKITATHERVDGIPAIIAHLKTMRVAACLETHFPTNGQWQDLRRGGTTVVWLACILSESAHRLSHVEPWVTAPRRTRSRCVGRQGTPRDLSEDRWATILDSLSVAERWVAVERAIHQAVLRVDDRSIR
jgi:hypothetical protein